MTVGAWGAVILSFFGAVFAALTMRWQWHVSGAALVVPFVVFAGLALAAGGVLRLPGAGVRPSDRARRVIAWSSMAEGIGMFVIANIVLNLHRPDLLLPAMAVVVGLHFLPIAAAMAFRPFHVLGAALIVAGVAGMAVGAPHGGTLAGLASAAGLWLAAILAVRRDWRARRAGPAPLQEADARTA